MKRLSISKEIIMIDIIDVRDILESIRIDFYSKLFFMYFKRKVWVHYMVEQVLTISKETVIRNTNDVTAFALINSLERISIGYIEKMRHLFQWFQIHLSDNIGSKTNL